MAVTELRAQTQDVYVPGLKKPVADNHVNIKIFDTEAEFNTAYDEACADVEPEGTGATVGACFFHAEHEELVDGYVGELWFDRENIDRDQIIHEAVHVGVYVAQLHFGSRKYRPLRLSVDDRTREEIIAYIAAPLADHLIEVLLETPRLELAA
ncbi:hypothetical protein [Rhodococcoides fascians]|uniref:hypothetical protein n=1 Tax=Rhodococcoides fascians TaxID=1828 RepID=UPI00055D008F|nr:hypothetical protein [Rhodococcus fascians]